MKTKHMMLFLLLLAVSCKKEEPVDGLIYDLGKEAVRAEYLTDDSEIQFGTEKGRAHYKEADLRYHQQTQGWYSWRDQQKAIDCALLLGGEAEFYLTIFKPRPLKIELSCGAVEEAVLKLHINGNYAGQAIAPKGQEFRTLSFDLQQSWIKPGENRFKVEMDSEKTVPLPGLQFPVKLSGYFQSAKLIQNPGPEFSWTQVPSKKGTDLILPTGAVMRYYLALETGWKLKGALSSRGGPVKGQVVLKVQGMSPKIIFTGEAGAQKTELSIDLGSHDKTPCSLTLISGEPGEEKKNSYLRWSGLRITGKQQEPKEIKRTPPHKKPNIVVLLLDAASSFFFKSYQGDYNAAPSSHDLAQDSVVFKDAVAPAPYTLPSVGAIMTGWLPDRHGVVWNANREGKNMKLSSNTPTLAETLKTNGYQTFAVLTNPNTSKIYGYAKGFDHYDELFSDPNLWKEGVDPLAAVVRARELLKSRDKSRPFFLYLHLFQPHAPYTPPEQFVSRFSTPYEGVVDGGRAVIDGFKDKGEPPLDGEDFKRLKELYAANLAWADHGAGSFINHLKASGLYEDSMIVLCSDHGEAFGEHRSIEHGHHLYEEGIRVPLIIKYPQGQFAGTVEENTAGLTDLPLTIAGAAGVEGQPGFGIDGQDLYGFLKHPEETQDRFFLARSDVYKPSYSLRWRGWQYIYDSLNRREELYFIPNDPRQSENLLIQNSEAAGYLRTQLCRVLCELLSEDGGEALVLDEDFIRSIEGLGYAGPGAGASTKTSSKCPLIGKDE